MFVEIQKGIWYTCQAEMVINSLTPSVALLVCPGGTIHTIVDYHEFTKSQSDSSKNRPGYL